MVISNKILGCFCGNILRWKFFCCKHLNYIDYRLMGKYSQRRYAKLANNIRYNIWMFRKYQWKEIYFQWYTVFIFLWSDRSFAKHNNCFFSSIELEHKVLWELWYSIEVIVCMLEKFICIQVLHSIVSKSRSKCNKYNLPNHIDAPASLQMCFVWKNVILYNFYKVLTLPHCVHYFPYCVHTTFKFL